MRKAFLRDRLIPSPTVFESFGLPGETAILRASGVINIIQLLASMPVIFTLDLVGRRPLLLAGSVFASLRCG